ncbi:LegC family aminotransferase [Veronia pacifica]|uniref:Aminotransferase DegT n=1 Tax=Veronia pacifica TaxID=1080227 RepID=A0A1C3EDH4_9GAMM|nr:LegC family aminotransferase [Veronia pacifica]ODA31288.1 aminotransferase DegT [Veronia pacifica]
MTPNDLVDFVRDVYTSNAFIPLHAPEFNGNEKQYVSETIDSTFVSSVGQFVDEFEKRVVNYTGASAAVATVNGTAALHTALHLAGVRRGEIVITQALTFVATCNAIHHMGAEPAFVDVSPHSLGMCPKALDEFLHQHAVLRDDHCVIKCTGQVARVVMPMHTFGHPVELDELLTVCQKWNLILVEDAAESLGSLYKGRHTGTYGDYAALSFNGNKVITTGGGGMVLCKSEISAERAKHLTTTAKISHPYEFYHDEAGFNYRMPNINAALGCGQIEKLDTLLQRKRRLALNYLSFFNGTDYRFVEEPDYAHSNYWLNAVLCPDKESRDQFLKVTNDAGVMTRPAWQLMHLLPMYSSALRGELTQSEYIAARLINLPSSAPPFEQPAP